ncbi:MAG: DegV family protein [Flexilinea sp.]|jgi:DegV family protein with EDD domain
MSFHIITDSCCDLPESLTSTYNNFDIAYLTYTIDGQPAPEGLTSKEFYNRLRNGSMAKTSQANPEAFVDLYKKALSEGKDVLYIGFSSALSGTLESGRRAKEILGNSYPDRRIITIDSLSASMGLGFLVDQAIRLRDSGKSLEEVSNWLESNKLKLNHWFTVDDLFFLQRGGRVSAGAAWFGSVINVKPVMNMDDLGRLIPREKILGRNKAIKRLFEKMKESAINPESQRIFISHGDCMDEVQILINLIKQNLGTKEFVVNYVGPVIGSHTGPGVIALYFMGSHR